MPSEIVVKWLQKQKKNSSAEISFINGYIKIPQQ